MWERLINQVEKLNISFDEFLALYKVYSYQLNKRQISYNSDMLNTYLELESKGFIKIITNQNEALTFHLREEGRLLIESFTENITPEQTHKPEEKKIINNQHKFEEFWLLFPNSDENGIYRKTRILKAGKDNCRRKYIEYLNSGIEHEDIIKALKYDVKLRRDINNKQNNMMYMKNSLTWLNQKEFEIILETMIEDNNSNSSDDWTSNLS